MPYFTKELRSQISVFLNIVTITEIYVLCVNESESKRWSHKNNWYSIWVVGNVLTCCDSIGDLLWMGVLHLAFYCLFASCVNIDV